MKIIITSATRFEVQALKELVAKNGEQNIQFHESGVGILQSTFSIQRMMLEEEPNLVIQVGIAGTFDAAPVLGDVVIVKEEFLGSCGVEEDGDWQDIFDLNLCKPNNFPFQKSGLKTPFLDKLNLLHLPEVRGITIDEISTKSNRIEKLKTKYQSCIETMEGAALHYCGLQYQIPFLQIRGISNYVGERDKQHWQLKEAINNVCEKTFEMLRALNNEFL